MGAGWETKAADHFTGTVGTLLTAHTPDLGASWVAGFGTSTTWTLDGANQLQCATGDAVQIIVNDTVVGNDQAAQITNTGTIRYFWGPFCRYDKAANNGYFGHSNNSEVIELYRHDAGSSIFLAAGG